MYVFLLFCPSSGRLQATLEIKCHIKVVELISDCCVCVFELAFSHELA